MAVNDTEVVVLVRAWKGAELDRILADFRETYGLPHDQFAVAYQEPEIARIRLNRPLPSYQLLFLINYMRYPRGFDLTSRAPLPVAVVALNEQFGAKPSLAGQRAAIYVPANDEEFDEVFLKLDSGATYRIPFTDMAWRPVADGREPRGLDAMIDDVPVPGD